MPDSDALARASNDLIYAAIAFYALAFLAYAALWATSRSRTTRLVAAGGSRDRGGIEAGGADSSPPVGTGLTSAALIVTVVGFAAHALGVVTRGLAAERVPWGNMYEFATTGALAVMATFLVVIRRHPIHAVGLPLTALTLVALGMAITVLYAPAAPLVPVLESYWLVIHVAAAIVAGGMFTLGAVLAAAYLVSLRSEQRRGSAAHGGPGTLGSSARIDSLSHAVHLAALPVWTFAVIAGAVWAENSWGRYWGWDPKETWAFITWVFYAAYLHAQSTAGWRGRKASWLALLGYVAFLFNFFGVNLWISGLHSYAGV